MTTAWLTAALFNADRRRGSAAACAALRQLLIGGEALSLPHVRRALAALPGTELINGYGPTECTTFTDDVSIPRDTAGRRASIPIGAADRRTRRSTCSTERRRRCRSAIVGELYVGGRGSRAATSRRPELDAERFVADHLRPAASGCTAPAICVRWLPDGALEFVGRADHQVKIRGFRIELGEIETRLGALPGVTAVRGDRARRRPGRQAARRATSCRRAATRSRRRASRARSRRVLPEFMVPAAFVTLAALPVTANGKLDRARAAARRERAAGPGAAVPRAVGRARGGDLPRVRRGARPRRVGALDGFFELGGNSLLVPASCSRACATPGCPRSRRRSSSPRRRRPRSRARSTASAAPASGAPRPPPRRRRADEPIAIVGMAGRFPGAPDVEAFWENLCAGRETIRVFAPQELDPSIPAALRSDPAYVAARGVLDDVELFDAGFFGISPLEAQLIDPQHRHFLEVSWHALEHAGYVPETAPGPIGVFGGMYNATYFQRHLVAAARRRRAALGELPLMLGNEKDYVTTRVAHKLGLTGPGGQRPHRCSTSLVATAMAMDSLRNGGCDLALAGGVGDHLPAEQRLPLPGGRDGLARRPHAPVRRAGRRHGVLRRRRDRRAAPAGGRDRRRRSRSTP